MFALKFPHLHSGFPKATLSADIVRVEFSLNCLPYNINRESGFSLLSDMAQVHLAMWSHIVNPCFVNNPIPTPPTEAAGSHFVVWPFNKPTPLPAIPTPLRILNLVFHTNDSILT
jgi:hypothetical protein